MIEFQIFHYLYVIKLQFTITQVLNIKIDYQNKKKMRQSPLPQSEIPSCQTCNLTPLPESSQHLAFILLQIILILFSLKLALILVLLGYCVSKTIWVCPFCKREVEGVGAPVEQTTKDHIILRLNDFMLLISKTKFRIIASILVGALGYWFITQQNKIQFSPRVKVEQTWKSIVSNCGYDTYMQNSYKFGYLYDQYSNIPGWDLQGIYLETKEKVKFRNSEMVLLKVKMNPTQFKDENTQDIGIFVQEPKIELSKGDIIRFQGMWSGHNKHILLFQANKIQKTDKKITDFEKQIQILSHQSLRIHNQ